jgi:hypothetical protein
MRDLHKFKEDICEICDKAEERQLMDEVLEELAP